MNSTLCSHGTDRPTDHLKLPEFVKPITATQAALRRWKHNLVSWSAVPFRTGAFQPVVGGASSLAEYPQSAVLMYHRVCDSPRHRFAPTYTVSPRRFRRQLSWLLDRGYTPLKLVDLVAAISDEIDVPKKSFVVTFDDGYENNCTEALPILKELGVPATVFVATSFIGSQQAFPFDDWMVDVQAELPAATWRPAGIEHYHQMLDSGVIELGAHTHTHADFRDSPDLLREDLQQCLERLQMLFGIENPAFAYPFGEPEAGFASEELAAVVQELGCYCGLQTGNRSLFLGVDRFHVPRFDVASGDTGASLATKIDGQHEALRSRFRAIKGGSR